MNCRIPDTQPSLAPAVPKSGTEMLSSCSIVFCAWNEAKATVPPFPSVVRNTTQLNQKQFANLLPPSCVLMSIEQGRIDARELSSSYFHPLTDTQGGMDWEAVCLGLEWERVWLHPSEAGEPSLSWLVAPTHLKDGISMLSSRIFIIQFLYVFINILWVLKSLSDAWSMLFFHVVFSHNIFICQ